MREVNGTNEMAEQIKALQTKVEKLEAESEIRKLHHKYGYYLDKCLYKEVHALFASHPSTYVQFLNGRFLGLAGVERLYLDRFAATFVRNRNGPVHGFLLDHLQAQDIVDYDAETGIVKARFRALMSAGMHYSIDASQLGRVPKQWWEGGVYENEYVKEDGVWKILKLRYFPFWHGTVEHGWQYTPHDYVPPFDKLLGEDPLGPDEFVGNDDRLWPDTRAVPFHYPHPVTGEMVAELDLRAPLLGGDPTQAKAARILK